MNRAIFRNGKISIEEGASVSIPSFSPQAEIDSCKSQLSATDYKAIKFAEGLISVLDYEPIKAERQALRDRINELEAQLRITTN